MRTVLYWSLKLVQRFEKHKAGLTTRSFIIQFGVILARGRDCWFNLRTRGCWQWKQRMAMMFSGKQVPSQWCMIIDTLMASILHMVAGLESPSLDMGSNRPITRGTWKRNGRLRMLIWIFGDWPRIILCHQLVWGSKPNIVERLRSHVNTSNLLGRHSCFLISRESGGTFLVSIRRFWY